MTEPDPTYAGLPEEAQVEVLRGVALVAAARFGLDVGRMELLLHAYNTTFDLTTTDGRRAALRVNTNSKSTRAHVAAQQAWVHALRTETDVHVPDAVAAPGGERVVAVPCPEAGRELLVVVNTWLEGDDVGDPGPEQARALGRAMATMHAHAARWTMPDGAALPRFDSPLFGDEDVLTAAVAELDGGAAVVAEGMRRCRAAFEALAAEPVQPLHADLHGGNLKWHDGRLAVFDFDDAGLGVPVLDLAISTFYLRRSSPGSRASEEALRAGYREVAPLPVGTDDHLEALVAARQLLLANDLLGSSTASLRAMAAGYLGTTLDRLRAWFDTGTFRLDVTA